MKIKKILFLFLLALIGQKTFASSGTLAETSSLIALILSIIAIALTIYNTFWIRRNKQVHEVDMVNYKDDVNLTMEGIREQVANDVRNIRRESGRQNRPNNPNQQNQQQKKVQEPEKPDTDKTGQNAPKEPEQNKPGDRRPNQKRRYNPHRRYKKPDQREGQKPEDTKPDNE